MAQTVGSRDVEGCIPQVGRHLLGGLMGLAVVTATVALLLMWSFLTEPVEVAHTVRQGNLSEVSRLVATAVYDLVARFLAWL
jgi:hypothetical protein